mmetsp:Transcript_63292/g.133499  ORF Transcript_63292/g.133499 Transcript_63292/m.133499 type:complete len:106 (+) Transcript_63292:47-364(+)
MAPSLAPLLPPFGYSSSWIWAEWQAARQGPDFEAVQPCTSLTLACDPFSISGLALVAQWACVLRSPRVEMSVVVLPIWEVGDGQQLIASTATQQDAAPAYSNFCA